MKKLGFILFMFCAFTIKAQTNLVKNGSFELNTPPPPDSITGMSNCWVDTGNKIDYENIISFSYHFGDDYTISLFKLPCLICFPPATWGGYCKEWGLGFNNGKLG